MIQKKLTEKEIECLFEKGILIRTNKNSYNEQPQYGKDSEEITFYFTSNDYNYYLNKETNTWANQKFYEWFLYSLKDRNSTLEESIKVKTQLLIHKEGSRLNILKKEYELTITEIEKTVTEGEFELLGEYERTIEQIAFIFSNELDRLLTYYDNELNVFPVNSFEEDTEDFEMYNKYSELMNYSYRMHWLVKEIEKETNDSEGLKDSKIETEIGNDKPLPKKLKWLGTPAQFGFIINELIGKGYLERPTTSFNKDAQFYLSIIDIETKNGTTTIGNLANEVNENKNSFSGNNAAKFTIPHKDKLS